MLRSVRCIRTALELNPACREVGNDLVERGAGEQAEVGGARSHDGRVGQVLAAELVEVELLLPERERRAR